MNQPIHFQNLPTHEIRFSECESGIEIVMSDPRQSVFVRGRLDWDQLNQFTEWIATIGTDIPSSQDLPNTDFTPYD